MPSERVQRQVERLLDEAEAGIARGDWVLVEQRAGAVLRLDPDNEDAKHYLRASHRNDAPGGEGGRKRVYLAHDTRLDRDVAIAVIKTEGLDAAGLARVRNEAQSMARLGDYPNVVTVFDVGEEEPSTGSGQVAQPYMVSQYMAGGSVEELIAAAEDHRLPLEEAVRIATQVCQGLEQAHRRGIVHRDLKPGNIWLTGEATGTASGSPPSPSTERG